MTREGKPPVRLSTEAVDSYDAAQTNTRGARPIQRRRSFPELDTHRLQYHDRGTGGRHRFEGSMADDARRSPSRGSVPSSSVTRDPNRAYLWAKRQPGGPEYVPRESIYRSIWRSEPAEFGEEGYGEPDYTSRRGRRGRSLVRPDSFRAERPASRDRAESTREESPDFSGGLLVILPMLRDQVEEEILLCDKKAVGAASKRIAEICAMAPSGNLKVLVRMPDTEKADVVGDFLGYCHGNAFDPDTQIWDPQDLIDRLVDKMSFAVRWGCKSFGLAALYSYRKLARFAPRSRLHLFIEQLLKTFEQARDENLAMRNLMLYALETRAEEMWEDSHYRSLLSQYDCQPLSCITQSLVYATKKAKARVWSPNKARIEASKNFNGVGSLAEDLAMEAPTPFDGMAWHRGHDRESVVPTL